MQMRDGSRVDDPRLDRLRSTTSEHLEKYPLTAATLPATATSMVIGVNWYSNFDSPVPYKFGKGRGGYHVIGKGDLGRVRGGHATALKHHHARDHGDWWTYYNQGTEGRCVEFATLRAMTLHNRRRYDITSRWHYFQMQMTDEWQGGSYPNASPIYEGTSVRAGLEIMRQAGAIRARPKGRPISLSEAESKVDPQDGIAAYRWALNWQDVRTVLGLPDWLPGAPMLNSWGRGYPHLTILLDEAGERLLHEDGEFGVITDR